MDPTRIRADKQAPKVTLPDTIVLALLCSARLAAAGRLQLQRIIENINPIIVRGLLQSLHTRIHSFESLALKERNTLLHLVMYIAPLAYPNMHLMTKLIKLCVLNSKSVEEQSFCIWKTEDQKTTECFRELLWHSCMVSIPAR